MIGNANANGTPFDKAAGGIPPLASNLISWNFKQGFGAAIDDLSSKDYINDSDEPARFVSSYCLALVGDASSSIIYRPPASFDSLLGKSWTVEFEYVHTADVGGAGYVLSCCTDGTFSTFSHGIYVGGNVVGTRKFGYFDGVTVHNCTTTLTLGATYKLKLVAVNQIGDPTKNDLSFYINGSLVNTITGASAKDMKYIESIGGRTSSLSNSGVGLLWSMKFYDANNVLKVWYPFQHSGYDVTGNGHHSSRIGLLTTAHYTQDTLHYNLTYGCDIYSLDSAPTTRARDIYVPYVSGSPVVPSITGYTKYKTCPAGYWHNGCETKIVVGTNGTKDANGWQAWTDARFTTGAFKTNAGVIKTVAQADPNEILISRTTAPIGYCKEINLNTADPVQTGYYIIFDNTEPTKIKNFLWWSGDGEPTNDASANALKFVRKTDFMLSDEGAYLTDDDGHVLCLT